MIAGATRGQGGPALARHLLSRKAGQAVEVMEARGLAADDLPGQLRELVASAAHGRTDRPVHHVHIDPPPDAPDPAAVMEAFLRRYEHEFGLEDSARCGVRHEKGGRQHWHVVWSLVRPDGRIVDLRHDHARREKVSRLVEFECGLPWTKGKHNRAVAQALRRDGCANVADAMEAAGLLDGCRPVATSTPRERAQAERTAIPLAEVRTRALAAWRASNDGPAFAAALRATGLRLAEGDRGPVLVDRSGSAHSLTRSLSAAARKDGDRITAADVRDRLSGLSISTIEEARHDRRQTQAESCRGDLSRGTNGTRDLSTASPAPQSPRGGAERGRFAGRDQGAAHRDLGGPAASGRNPRSPRQRIHKRVAARALAGLDVGVLRQQAAALAAGGRTAQHEAATRENPTMARGLRPARALDFKTQLLAEAAPQGFDAAAWRDDLHMIKGPSPGQPTTRILLRDGGWVEIDKSGAVVRSWGTPGRADALAAALASAGGCQTERLERTATTARNTDAPRRERLTEQQAETLVRWWHDRGYSATAAPDGCWVRAGASRIKDMGDHLEIHGPISDDAIRATVAKAREAWGGAAELTGEWSQRDQDRIWIEAQRQGIEIEGCKPSDAARRVWAAEQAAAAARTETMGLVRAGTREAESLRSAAQGDPAALGRLPPELAAFVSSYLDDDQRAELAQSDVADIIPELSRFLALGREELAEIERRKAEPGADRPPPRDFRKPDPGVAIDVAPALG